MSLFYKERGQINHLCQCIGDYFQFKKLLCRLLQRERGEVEGERSGIERWARRERNREKGERRGREGREERD